jgi:hypothetical protein
VVSSGRRVTTGRLKLKYHATEVGGVWQERKTKTKKNSLQQPQHSDIHAALFFDETFAEQFERDARLDLARYAAWFFNLSKRS